MIIFLILISIIIYSFVGCAITYVFRRFYRHEKNSYMFVEDSQLAGAFWPFFIPIWILALGWGWIKQKIENIYNKLDEYFDKLKINKKIIGYSTNEIDIKYPTLESARKDGATIIYRHFIDETWEKA